MLCAGLHAVFRSFVPDLSLRHTDRRYSCDVHGITDGIFVIAIVFLSLLQTQLGSPAPHYAVPRAVACPSSTRVMERRPNSGPDTPCPPPLLRRVPPGDMPPACLERGRSRNYRMMRWDGPRYPAFTNYESRLRSFQKRSWPHRRRSPGSFAAAGLFYTGTGLCISLPYCIATP